MTTPVVTRFAPSPTGFLHIGGARTALFNWLYAKRHGGTMLLRIEDTDRERSTQAAVDAIIDGLKWLGLSWEGEPISQFQRADRHADVARDLVAAGKAYYCYCTPEELNDMREHAKANGLPPRYDGRWRDRDPKEAPEGVKPAIRIKAPLEGETVIEDAVQGTVAFPNKDLDDFIILRSDGTPTYMHAVVVDDHDMGVTQIIRGDDHLTNTARQRIIYDALGWAMPKVAHIPLIHGPDGAKLSKRHGALGVEAYRAMGYLPVALRNYLVRLGWAHGDAEILSTDEMTALFDLEGIGRSPSRFDFVKLENLNGHYIRQSDDAELVAQVIALLEHIPQGAEIKAKLTDKIKGQFLAAMPGLKERAKTLLELLDGAGFLFSVRPLAYDEKAASLLDEAGKAALAAILPRLEALPDWTAAATEDVVRTYATETGLKLGKIAQPLRAAATGRSMSPPIFDVLAVLGRDEALGRIRDAI
ncbi:glutamate--tRNA ligase [Oryzibacter oryziterrae]|uniref:glutamate--tRNA ligase n=1 Tax=Oryzibacter oryziterrae TaxID=2766474 RepID=UPI001F00FAE4|nr:glutamate--tRNA ligase [Oryzibacter oryziterrae]